MFTYFHHLIITKAVCCFTTSNPKGLYSTNNVYMHCLDWCSSIVDKAQVKFPVSVGKKSADFHCFSPLPRDFVYSRGRTLSVTEWVTACRTSIKKLVSVWCSIYLALQLCSFVVPRCLSCEPQHCPSPCYLSLSHSNRSVSQHHQKEVEKLSLCSFHPWKSAGPVRLMIWVILAVNFFRNDDDLHEDTRRCLSTKHIVSDPYNTNIGLCVGWVLLRSRKEEQKWRQAFKIAYALCFYGSNSLESCACIYGIL